MAKRMISDPKRRFLSEMVRIRRDFQACYNAGNWRRMEGLYWENAVLVLRKSKRVIVGRRQIINFWRHFKTVKGHKTLKSIQPRLKTPRTWPVCFIEWAGRCEFNLYDMEAREFCRYSFNSPAEAGDSVDSYFHKRTCTTALSEQDIDI